MYKDLREGDFVCLFNFYMISFWLSHFKKDERLIITAFIIEMQTSTKVAIYS